MTTELDLGGGGPLEAARRYGGAGLSVIPLVAGGKFPDATALRRGGGVNRRGKPDWRAYQRRRASDAELEAWFAGRALNLGLVGGFGQVYGLDFDEVDCYTRWAEGCPRWAARLPTQQTARGYHVFFRVGGLRATHFRFLLPVYPLGVAGAGKVAGFVSLGQWVAVWPSVHPSGFRYCWLAGQDPWTVGLPRIPDLTAIGLRLEQRRPRVLSFLWRCVRDPATARDQWAHYLCRRRGEETSAGPEG